jgi:pimeloyl-ACP methyl ester carboxylesterase
MPHVSPQRLRHLRRLMSVLQAISPRLAGRVALQLFITPVRRGLDAGDAQWVSTARRHHVTSGPDVVQVYEWGTGPRTVVILHGWGSHAARFSPLAQALVSAGWRVLAIDAPGHGRSRGRSSSLPQFIAALDSVARELGPVQALIGHSLGALAAVNWLGKPGSPAAAGISQAVLVSTPSGVNFLMDSFIAMMGLDAVTTGHLATQFSRRFGEQPDVWSAIARAPGIHVPLLLVHDRGDDVIPFGHSEALMAVLPNAGLHATTGLGHSGMLRDPDTIARIVDFLK